MIASRCHDLDTSDTASNLTDRVNKSRNGTRTKSLLCFRGRAFGNPMPGRFVARRGGIEVAVFRDALDSCNPTCPSGMPSCWVRFFVLLPSLTFLDVAPLQMPQACQFKAWGANIRDLWSGSSRAAQRRQESLRRTTPVAASRRRLTSHRVCIVSKGFARFAEPFRLHVWRFEVTIAEATRRDLGRCRSRPTLPALTGPLPIFSIP